MKPFYSAEGIEIFCGDCREIVPTLSGVGVVLTDPPYGIEYRQPRKCEGRMSIAGDDAWSFPRPTVPFVVWGANNAPGYSDCGWLVWDKERYGTDLYGDGELAATDQVKGVRIFTSKWQRQHGYGWTGTHPTEKPAVLMEWCLGFLPGGLVLDPYMGSGGTLVAAKNLGRRAIGIDIEERYCEAAANRLRQAVLDFGGAA